MTDCREELRVVNHQPLQLRTVEGIKRKIGRLIASYRHRRQLRIDRLAFKQMLKLDDNLLDDIGVTRSNVEWASQLPIHRSAARALDRTKKRARPRIRP